jgi:hypothetical protein
MYKSGVVCHESVYVVNKLFKNLILSIRVILHPAKMISANRNEQRPSQNDYGISVP